jgi:hypothetical protein
MSEQAPAPSVLGNRNKHHDLNIERWAQVRSVLEMQTTHAMCKKMGEWASGNRVYGSSHKVNYRRTTSTAFPKRLCGTSGITLAFMAPSMSTFGDSTKSYTSFSSADLAYLALIAGAVRRTCFGGPFGRGMFAFSNLFVHYHKVTFIFTCVPRSAMRIKGKGDSLLWLYSYESLPTD